MLLRYEDTHKNNDNKVAAESQKLPIVPPP
jgi:hypothetical protein